MMRSCVGKVALRAPRRSSAAMIFTLDFRRVTCDDLTVRCLLVSFCSTGGKDFLRVVKVGLRRCTARIEPPSEGNLLRWPVGESLEAQG